MNAERSRHIDQWFAHYSADHRNAMNQRIHVVCVPLILWSILALLWCVPVPGTLFGPGLWSALAMFGLWSFYYRHSRALGFGMLALFALAGWLNRWLYSHLGPVQMAWLAAAVFVVAWIGQFIGHSALYENRKPSFFTDLKYLLVGPAWVLAKLYGRLGLRY